MMALIAKLRGIAWAETTLPVSRQNQQSRNFRPITDQPPLAAPGLPLKNESDSHHLSFSLQTFKRAAGDFVFTTLLCLEKEEEEVVNRWGS